MFCMYTTWSITSATKPNWLVCPAPDGGGAGPYTPEGNLAGYIDRTVLPGKLYLGIHDPEGLLGTVPATATALLGMMAGTWVRLQQRGLTPGRKALGLAVGGATLVAAGWLWHLAFPINKNLWSSSFVCVAGGLSALLFALFYYLIDVTHWWRQTLFLRVIGLNSITIYMAQRIVGFGGIAAFLLGGLVGLLPETWQETGMAAAYLTVSWLFLYFLWRHRIFLKT